MTQTPPPEDGGPTEAEVIEALEAERADPIDPARREPVNGASGTGGGDALDGEPPSGAGGSQRPRIPAFRLGFVGAAGALTAFWLLGLLGKLGSQLTLLVIALFLALGLDPAVRALQRRGLGRGVSVAIVFAALLAVFAGFFAAVVPTLVTQASQITTNLPADLQHLQEISWVQKLDARYDIISNLNQQLTAKLKNGTTLLQLFGGVFGAGKAVISGAFTTFTVLVLTLYFLASLRPMIEAGYRLVPSSRRPKVRTITEEIIRRIGGYIAGQFAVASINGVCMLVVLSILNIDYKVILAITVGIFGLIPLVGATLGALIVVIVALFHSWQAALIVIIYVNVYQQIENYVIAPRIMSQTVSVPGSVAMVAALAGGTLMGVVGALIAIPVAAGILLVIEEVVLPRQSTA